jgi:hypothetical protein
MGWDAFGSRWQNRSNDRVRRDEIDPAVLAEHEERNCFDRALHDFAGAQLDAALRDLDVPRALRRLTRANRIEHLRDRAQERTYPLRRVGSRVKRAVLRRTASRS